MRRLIVPLAVVLAHAAHAQPPKPAYNPFSVATWASLDTGHASLIRSPAQQGPLNLAAREEDDQSLVTVYAKKRVLGNQDLGRRTDAGEPGVGEGMEPFTVPIGPPTDCAGSSYQTIGGQAATGADMVGALGGGRC